MLPGVRSLGALLAEDAVLLVRQALAPLVVALREVGSSTVHSWEYVVTAGG